MRPLGLYFTQPLINQFSSISTGYLRQIRFDAGITLLKLFEILALKKLAALAAICKTLLESADSGFAGWRSSPVPASPAHSIGLYAGETAHEFLKIKLPRKPLFQPITLNHLVKPCSQFCYGTVAACTAAAPDSAKADLILHV